MIYLDNAATTIHKPKKVIEAVVEAMTSLGNASRGTHESSISASMVVYSARKKIAEFFNCPRADHVIFTSNSTEAINIAINGLLSKGDHVISTDMEHNSVLRPLYRLQKENELEISFLHTDKKGSIKISDLSKVKQENTKAIVCTHASNLTGNINNIEKIGEFAKKHGLLFIVDASQTAGCIPIDMVKMHIDALCFTGHKSMMGPQGTGGLCLFDDLDIKPFKVGGTGVQTYEKYQPDDFPVRLEAGTLNTHGIAGLSAAVDFINNTGIEKIYDYEMKLMERFLRGVAQIPNVKLYGDFSKQRTPVVALNIADYNSSDIAFDLSETYDIATRPGSHCAPRMHKAFGTVQQGMVRFSFSYYNTEDEIDRAIKAVKEIASL